MQGLFVVSFKLVLVLGLQLLLINVEVNSHLLVLLKLHDDEGVSCLALAEWRI
jgi:hypothetical protein